MLGGYGVGIFCDPVETSGTSPEDDPKSPPVPSFLIGKSGENQNLELTVCHEV